MILVTLGSSQFKFERLLKYVDRLLENLLKDEEVIIQAGYTNYNSEKLKIFSMIEEEKFEELLKDADIVITHAGVGTIIKALKYGKKIIVCPRLKKFNEHVDDHQIEISKMFEKDNFVLMARNENELEEKIKAIKNFVPTKFESNKERMNELIIKLIDEGKKNEKKSFYNSSSI